VARICAIPAARSLATPGPPPRIAPPDAPAARRHAHRAACPMWKGMRPPPELGEGWDEPSAEWAATEVTPWCPPPP
jgi:hypothetical protein